MLVIQPMIMARFEHLPIYKSCYILTREIYRVTLKLPRDLKHTLGPLTFESTLRCLRGVVVANGSRNKSKVLQEISLEAEVIWTHLRLLYDMKGISQGEFQLLSERLAEVTKQLQAWSVWEQKAAHAATAAPKSKIATKSVFVTS